MTFIEWFDKAGPEPYWCESPEDAVSLMKENLKAAWNAALEEAAKACFSKIHEYRDLRTACKISQMEGLDGAIDACAACGADILALKED